MDELKSLRRILNKLYSLTGEDFYVTYYADGSNCIKVIGGDDYFHGNNDIELFTNLDTLISNYDSWMDYFTEG